MTASEEMRPEQDARWQLARQVAREMDSARMTLIVAVAAASRLARLADADESHEILTRTTAGFQALLEADLKVLLSLVRQWRLETLAQAGDDGLRIIAEEADDDDEEDATDD